MREDIIKNLAMEGILVDADVVDLLLQNPTEISKLKKSLGKGFWKKEDVLRIISPVEESAQEVKKKNFTIVKNLDNIDMESSPEYFRNLFLYRYKVLFQIFKRNPALRGMVKISFAKKIDGEVAIVGMVRHIWRRKIRIEDDTGWMDVVLPRDFNDVILEDEVIGVRGYKKNDVIFANEVFYPDIEKVAIIRKKRGKLAVIGDVHVGSKMFEEERFLSFLDYLKGSDVDFLAVVGDLVDGVGIYPNQEEELEYDDVYEQYDALASYLKEIPSRIDVFLIPGNHDFVQLMEPQPPLDGEIAKKFPSNVHCLSNPSWVEIDGVRILMYHGTSLNDLIERIPNASYENIEPALIHILKARHLVPIYGAKVSLVPTNIDHLVVDKTPHIFLTGHVHSYYVNNYKNTLVVNASTWQSMTKYQKMMNFQPVVGKVCLINLDDLSYKTLSF